MSTTDAQGGFLTRNFWVILAAVAAVVAVSVMGLRIQATSATTESQREQITALEADVRGLQAEGQRTASEDIASALGVSQERIAADREVLTMILSRAFTWDSAEALIEARNELMDSRGLDPQSTFLTEFLPYPNYNTDAEGKRYYAIDAKGLTSRLSGELDMTVIGIDGTDYRYAVVATVVNTAPVTDSNGTAGLERETRRQMLMYVTVDSRQRITDISGVPASGSVRVAG